MSSEYWKLLQDPRWQEKRLRVFEAADFKCIECGSNSDTLHAHHKIYRKGRKPWEYDLKDLACLCEACHERWHMLKDAISELMVGLEMKDISRMAGFGLGMVLKSGEADQVRVYTDAAFDGLAKQSGASIKKLRSLVDSDGFINESDLRPHRK